MILTPIDEIYENSRSGRFDFKPADSSWVYGLNFKRFECVLKRFKVYTIPDFDYFNA